MQYSNAIVLALAGAVAASPAAIYGRQNATAPYHPGEVVVTEVVTAFTTVCPSPTTFAVNNVTYTVKSSTTLTITGCPCTVTKAAPPPPPATHPVPATAPHGNSTVHPVVPATKPATVPVTAATTKPAGAPATTARATGSASSSSRAPTRTIVAAAAHTFGANAAAAIVAAGLALAL